MQTSLLLLAALTLSVIVLFGLDLWMGNRSMAFLRDVSPSSDSALPGLSVIVPARNEERNLREALTSLLRQDYPGAEWIVVNDRSTDGTAAILADVARDHPRLRIIAIADLPAGWLGKNYALYRGAQLATGELLLFADADIVMAPDVFRRAVGHLLQQRLDHLAVMPELRMPGVLLGMISSAFGLFFAAYARPWKAKDPRSAAFVGIGAFNLVRAEAYRAAGTHQAIAMRPDDDIKLGKLLKKRGYRQEMAIGTGMIHVEWYSSLPELIDGLMKNSFAGVEYSVAGAIAAGLALLLVNLWPLPALFLTHGVTRLLNLLIVAALFLIPWCNNRFHRLPPWYAIGQPLGGLLFAYIVWKSMLKAIWNGGISWRGTHYPLRLLKANKI